MSERTWYKISAKGKTLGRLATESAVILMGKRSTDFSRYEDKGDFLIITDADKVTVSGKKEEQKEYFKISQYPGHSRFISYAYMKENHPERIIMNAVKGMLPKNKLGRRMLTRLKVYVNSDHPHEAQLPIALEDTNG
jgi:large subunit ribosomal protein L13